MIYSFLQNGNTAVTIQFENKINKEINGYVTSLCALIEGCNIDGVIELIPTFASLTVMYDCTIISSAKLKKKISKLIKSISTNDFKKSKIYHIPVCYDDEFALDIENVIKHTGLNKQEIINLHTKKPYLIYMLGFLPGFAYLGGMDKKLFTPRLKTPRLQIFEGAVGIGGEQTGIYPIASPGGWQLIGKTPVKVYDKSKDEPILYKAGDYIQFYSIDKVEFEKIKNQVQQGTFQVKIEEVQI